MICNFGQIIRENGENVIVRLDDGLFYIARADKDSGHFYSAIPADHPKRGGRWIGPWTEDGLRFVAKGHSRAAADAQWRRHIEPLSA